MLVATLQQKKIRNDLEYNAAGKRMRYIYNIGSNPGAIFLLRGHLAVYGDSLGCCHSCIGEGSCQCHPVGMRQCINMDCSLRNSVHFQSQFVVYHYLRKADTQKQIKNILDVCTPTCVCICLGRSLK